MKNTQINGTDFESNERMQILADGTFSIESVTRLDEGTFTCIVENSMGNDGRN